MATDNKTDLKTLLEGVEQELLSRGYRKKTLPPDHKYVDHASYTSMTFGPGSVEFKRPIRISIPSLQNIGKPGKSRLLVWDPNVEQIFAKQQVTYHHIATYPGLPSIAPTTSTVWQPYTLQDFKTQIDAICYSASRPSLMEQARAFGARFWGSSPGATHG